VTALAWEADAQWVERSVAGRFLRAAGMTTYAELAARSVADPSWYWDAVVRFLDLPFDTPYDRVLDDSRGPQWARWFVGGEINAAVLCTRAADTTPDRLAVIAEREDGEVTRLTYAQLRDQVARAAGALAAMGVRAGDAVGLFMPYTAEAVVAFLAAGWLGAAAVPVFSGMGAPPVARRLTDSGARVLVTADAVIRRGARVPTLEVAREAVRLAAGAVSLLVVDDLGTAGALGEPDRTWAEALAAATPAPPARTSSEDPFLIAFTSGTTGRPKGAVHTHGGFPIQCAQEGAFDLDIGPADVVTWVSDLGWIMGPWTILAALANQATLALYAGAPDRPDSSRVWQVVDRHGITVLGVSPTLIRALQSAGDVPVRTTSRASLRVFGSTGEPWTPSPWQWLHEVVGERRRPIVNVSGGTEAGILLAVQPLLGVKPVSVGAPTLGKAVNVLGVDGQPLGPDQLGELAVTAPFPGMTRGFYREGPERYLAAYWNRFPDVWVHGDWTSYDEDGFWYIHGRSDDTLNVGGKRIGPAEVEAVLDAHPEVVTAAVVGIPHPVKGEVMAAFCVTVPGVEVDDALAARLRAAVIAEFGKAFGLQELIFVADLPKTRSGKVMRRLVRAHALGEQAGDLTGLDNPEALDAVPRLGHSQGPQSSYTAHP
jgi:acetyl-CoA synthetase